MPIRIALASVVETLTQLAEPWVSLYDDSTAVSIGVIFLHLASLLVGGGLALTMDRATLRAVRGGSMDRERHLAEMRLTHRSVIAALGVTLVTGALLFLTDVEAYATSRVFWVKMTVVALLLINGFAMTRTERRLRDHDARRSDAAPWQRLRSFAMVSGALWLMALLAGTIIANS